LSEFEWEIPKSARKEMNVPARVYGSKFIVDTIEEEAFKQLTNVACLPGVVNYVVGLSDMHWGYGLPMGAVGAFHEKDGVISAGCTGFDINCGVRLIKTNLSKEDVTQKIQELVSALFRNVPSGVGSTGRLRLTPDKLDEVLVKGAAWAVENGYGIKEDLNRLEENGCMKAADPSKISANAKRRGMPQLGTLGAGNHFLEIQAVDKIFDEKIGNAFGIENPNQVFIMLHCGSRGFGHQVATDYLKIHKQAAKKYNIWLPDEQLVCAPTDSQEGQDYFSAMKCAVNYAFTSRQVMTQWVRQTFEKIFGRTWQDMDMNIVYDVCHNICKFEEHEIGGKKQKLYVHRKGATRALPAGHPLVPNIYKDVGQPVLIAGTMGTASYVLVGAEKSAESFYSSCHGAGRTMSRTKAIKTFWGSTVKEKLAQKGIIAQATHPKVLAEEAPEAYKDVNEVINSVHGAGISLKVARMIPLGVTKG